VAIPRGVIPARKTALDPAKWPEQALDPAKWPEQALALYHRP